jgi:hypothetical protein
MLNRAWQGWKHIARAIGTFQARVLLTIFYAVVVLPFGIFVRAFLDPMRIKVRPSGWLEQPTESHDRSWAKRQ